MTKITDTITLGSVCQSGFMKNKWVVFLFITIFFSSILDAGIEKYFRKIENKGNNHKIANIDFIYMINLDERPEKFAQSMAYLAPYGIVPFRFSAINGWTLSHEVISNVGLKFDPATMCGGALGTVFRCRDGKVYESHEVIGETGTTYYALGMSLGSIGIVLSHLSVLQDAYDSGYNTIWVMEDDIQVMSNPHELSGLISKLDKLYPKWDVFFTDPETKNTEGEPVFCCATFPKPNFKLQPTEFYLKNIPLGKNFKIIGARYGAYSMIIRRSGIKKLLKFIKEYKIYLPFDFDYCYPPGIRLVSCTRDIVSTLPRALSDNASPRYSE